MIDQEKIDQAAEAEYSTFSWDDAGNLQEAFVKGVRWAEEQISVLMAKDIGIDLGSQIPAENLRSWQQWFDIIKYQPLVLQGGADPPRTFVATDTEDIGLIWVWTETPNGT